MRERRYEGRSNLSRVKKVAIICTIIGMISILNYLSGISFLGMRFWGILVLILAICLWIGIIFTGIAHRCLRADVFAYLEFHEGNLISIENMSQDLMMNRESLLRLLGDMRMRGRIKFRIDLKMDTIILGESCLSPLNIKIEMPISSVNYYSCFHCRGDLAEESIFCPSCGGLVQ